MRYVLELVRCYFLILVFSSFVLWFSISLRGTSLATCFCASSLSWLCTSWFWIGSVRFCLIVLLNKFFNIRLSNSIEIRIPKSFNGWYSIFGVQFKHPRHQDNSLLRQLSNISIFQCLWSSNFWKLVALECLVSIKQFNHLCWQRAKNLLNMEKLVYFTLPREQRVSIAEFSHHTAYSPYVNFLSIVASKQQFWRSVPSCSHIICKLAALISVLRQRPCKAEIT